MNDLVKHYSNMLDNGATLETIQQIMNTQLSEIDVKSEYFYQIKQELNVILRLLEEKVESINL